MRQTHIAGALASAAILACSAPIENLLADGRAHMGRTRYPTGWAGVNSSRYMPHQGKREIARRQRQAATA